jgi:putative ABC transport system permease protein
MFQNYFRTAWRSLLRNRLYSLLNVLGLAIGMAVALLIGLWVHDQYTYDHFPGYRQAYQVRYNYNNNGEIRTQTEVCIPLAAALKNDIPEIAYTASAFGPASYGSLTTSLRVNDVRVNPDGLTADEDFLKIVQYPLVEGNANEALKEPNSLVITQSLAKALFGDKDPLNQTIVRNGSESLKVTGVLKDLDPHSSLQFGCISSFKAFAAGGWVKAATTNWNHTFFQLYASLKPHVRYDQVAPKISGLVKKYAPETWSTFRQEVIMQPMADWHLYTEYRNGVASGGLIEYIRMFSIIGGLVLLIACINFMNLSTARSEKRAREVGIRKVAGSSRRGLILQFLIESVVVAFLAFLLALLLIQTALPAFNALAHTAIRVPYDNPTFWGVMISYLLFTGLLAGSRPAFYLSSFQPAKVLKSTLGAGRSAALSRKVLVVLQFSCSIALIIGTIIIYQQIQHARMRPRGYDPNRLVYTPQGGSDFEALKDAALQTGVVSNMTRSLSPATEIYSHNTVDDWPGKLPNEPLSLAMNALVDSDYFKTMGIPFVAGSNFKGIYAADSNCVILNEAAVRRMRLKDPINQYLTWHLSNAPNRLRIIGVVGDALTNAPFSPPEPTMFVFQPWTFTIIYRLAPNVNTQSALLQLKPLFEKYNPDFPFEYHFVDESYATKFQQETLIGRLAGIFAALAVFISCLGLFGLAAYVAEQRTKEIGIRKVLGASIGRIYLMLTRDFILLVIISCVIASPLAFYLLQNWLEKYSYRITIGPVVFVLAAVTAVLITAATISVQAIRAARANPAASLRSE